MEVFTWMIGNFQTSKSLNVREREYRCLCSCYVINTYARFRRHLLQNSLIVELYTYATDCKDVAKIPESHFVKAFSELPSHFNDVSSVTKAPSLQYWFQSTEQAKISCSQVRKVWGMFLPVLSHCSMLRSPWPKLTGVLKHCCEGETNCWFSIFRGLPFRPHP
jgi:hypothetical protein